MGCGNCGTSVDGKPAGCKSNGGCSTGGCNRMNVFDWLSELPLSDTFTPFNVIEVTFNKGSRKEFFRNSAGHNLFPGQWIAVESSVGYDVGQVSLQGELVKLQMKKYNVQDTPEIKKVLRAATDEDMLTYSEHKAREGELLVRSRAIARYLKLEMKIAEAEIQADGKKATFFYTADQRVDFRELIKMYASEFKAKVEMRQIGARQESGKVGGIGSCGRELCCATWLTDFKTVNTAAARYQNLSINQTKLSGQCGRLKCCLNYELDTYMDALKVFPGDADAIETIQGKATLQKRDIFKNLMWYSFHGSNKQYPLTIERVKEIVQLNKDGVKPEELKALQMEEVIKPKEGVRQDMGFVNDVGGMSLRALERNNRKRRNNTKPANNDAGSTTQQKAEQGQQKQGHRNEQRNRPQKQQQPQQQGGEQKKKQQQQRPQRPKPEGGEATQAAAGEDRQQRNNNNRRRPPRQGNRSTGGDAGQKPDNGGGQQAS